MLDNTIPVKFDSKTRRLVFKPPFHLSDVLRGFPSRRFDPKGKVWKVPLVRANVVHLQDTVENYKFEFDQEAINAIEDFEKIVAAPVKTPFPHHLYDFTRSTSKYLPMAHQDLMLNDAWGHPAHAWFAKMGTGKTFAAIHLACARYAAGLIDGVMIICPSTLRTVWMKEFVKYATLDYDFQIHETKANFLGRFYADKAFFPQPLQILAVSVEGLGVSPALFDSACGFMPRRRIFCICDESSRIKNPDAARTKRAIELGAASKYRLILNGTPIALGIQDLWSQYEFLDPNIIGMGDYWAFKTKYIEMGGWEQKQIVGYKDVEDLMHCIIPYTTEVGKDVLKLPPKVPMIRPIELTKVQRDLIRLVVKGASADPDAPMIKVTNTLEKMLRCRQIVGGWLPHGYTVMERDKEGNEFETIKTILEPLDVNPKMDDLFTMIEDNYGATKFIIWTNFVHEIVTIAGRLAERYGNNSVETYYGETPMELRSEIEDRYCTDPTLRFFVGNPVAAGLGLTLISGENDVMVYYSGTNAYIERAQSEDRAHRIGQSNSVVVIDMVATKSIDEVIQASISSKMDIEEYLMTRIAAGISIDDLLMGGVK